MSNAFVMKLTDIQPSQLYVSESKLAKVYEWFRPEDQESYDPLPVKDLNGKIIFTDGHTRALAAYIKGVEAIKVYWDPDDLDWEAYQICVDWCNAEGVHSIAALAERIITPEAYKTLWLNRCQQMQDELEQIRQSG